VAGALGEALEVALRHPVELTCAGRTDAGVHARGQVVTLDADEGADLERLLRALNGMLGPAIAVHRAAWAPAGFDARRSAVSRRYRYSIVCGAWPDPLTAATSWHVEHVLDVRAMQAAADVLLGEHDFSSFCRAARGRPVQLVRRVVRADWDGPPAAAAGEGWPGGGDARRLWFDIEANAFCHQMVRSVVGTLVEVGRGRRTAGEMMAVLAARTRATAGQIAPPHGLCLVEVGYPPGLSPWPAVSGPGA
jgi:tRNA pseudouridine38-40 synthase